MTPADVAAWRLIVGAPPGTRWDDVVAALTREWQRAHMLEPDGVVGPRTRARYAELGRPMSWHDAGIIAGLHPSMHVFAVELLRASKVEEGIALVVTQGTRSMREQGDLFARGRTTPGPVVTNAPPGSSWHNFGLAFDVAVLADGRATWPADAALWARIGAVGKDLGLEWGGDWARPDRPHFQRTGGLTLAAARRGQRPAA